jgi:ribonuclease HI
VPQPRAPAGRAAAQARRARTLRRLPSNPLPGETHILKIKAFIDGAARGNPGPAGYGVFITTDTGEIIEISGYLGKATNNVAEYAGLLEALETAKSEGASEVEIVSDSELLVKQMLGVYKVKHPNLVPMHAKAKVLVRNFARFSIRHTLRAGNKDADRLANLAVDRADGRQLQRRRVE